MQTATTTPASTPIIPLSAAELTKPQRLALVIERIAPRMGEDCVTLEDFLHEPETCDLTEAEIGSNIGEAKRLIVGGAPEPTYDRAARVAHGVAAIRDLLPGRQAIMDRLAAHHFSHEEANRLAADIVETAAETWRKSGAVGNLPGWASEMLAANAE